MSLVRFGDDERYFDTKHVVSIIPDQSNNFYSSPTNYSITVNLVSGNPISVVYDKICERDKALNRLVGLVNGK